jgi:NAD(P)H-hydrate epimerase
MKILTSSILQSIYHPAPDSHKGQNGRVLVIAGSKKYHGALLLAIQALSRVVDMVYVYSNVDNLALIKKLRSEIAVFIAVNKKELWSTVELVDCIVIGPGLAETSATISLTKKILKKYPHKKILIDATALWHLNPEWLHQNCVVTPHSREFVQVFKCQAIAENVLAMAKKYNAVIALKGHYDYISDGHELWENRTGNPGMTKGGTGDVFAGLIGGLAAQNNLLTATLAGAFLSGYAGDQIHKKVGTFFNAEDLIKEVGTIWPK